MLFSCFYEVLLPFSLSALGAAARSALPSPPEAVLTSHCPASQAAAALPTPCHKRTGSLVPGFVLHQLPLLASASKRAQMWRRGPFWGRGLAERLGWGGASRGEAGYKAAQQAARCGP